METCNNAGTNGDLMVKQFVRSLKGNAFDSYTDLESGLIDTWEQLEHEFLNRFYSTRRMVSMIELVATQILTHVLIIFFKIIKKNKKIKNKKNKDLHVART